MAAHRWAPLNDPMIWLGKIEQLGAVWIALAVVVGVVRKLGPLKTLGLAVLAAVTTSLADAVAFGIKDLVNRPRPFEAHPQIHPLYSVHSSSFPAGHAATAFAGATLLAYFAPRAWPLFLTLAAAIGYSRVYVGVHYPGDVVTGAAVGVLVGAAVIAALRLSQSESVRAKFRSASTLLQA